MLDCINIMNSFAFHLKSKKIRVGGTIGIFKKTPHFA